MSDNNRIDCERCGGLGLIDHVWTQAEKSFAARFDLEMEDYMDKCQDCSGTGLAPEDER